MELALVSRPMDPASTSHLAMEPASVHEPMGPELRIYPSVRWSWGFVRSGRN